MPTREDLDTDEKKKAYWSGIIRQWDELTAFAPIPRFTKKHAEKMLARLDPDS